MQQLYSILAVAVGGAIGSTLRYLVSNWFVQLVGPGFPWGTFTINVTGAFAIGVVLQAAASSPNFSPYLRLFLATGIMGGYTTFSTYAYETFTLGSTERMLFAVAYAVGSVIVGVIAATLGVLTARALAAA
jgi:fluoride exporter